jgi:magnesium chelatase subunit I
MALRKQIMAARTALPALKTPGAVLHDCAALCIALGSDGLRGELTLLRAARAVAAFDGADTVTRGHLKQVATSALPNWRWLCWRLTLRGSRACGCVRAALRCVIG